jgi:hypothetical protein
MRLDPPPPLVVFPSSSSNNSSSDYKKYFNFIPFLNEIIKKYFNYIDLKQIIKNINYILNCQTKRKRKEQFFHGWV